MPTAFGVEILAGQAQVLVKEERGQVFQSSKTHNNMLRSRFNDCKMKDLTPFAPL